MMKRVMLFVTPLLWLGCQSKVHYWYNPERSFQQAKWDLVDAAEYTAYGCPKIQRQKNGSGSHAVTALASNLRKRGYKLVPKEDLPKGVAMEKVWLHLKPCYIAGVDAPPARWPDCPKPSPQDGIVQSSPVNEWD